MKSNRKILVFTVLISSILFSSCGSRKEENKQKMIITYESIKNTNEILEKQCFLNERNLEMHYHINQEKVGPYFYRAKQIINLSERFINKLSRYEQEMIETLMNEDDTLSIDEFIYENFDHKKENRISRSYFKKFDVIEEIENELQQFQDSLLLLGQNDKYFFNLLDEILPEFNAKVSFYISKYPEQGSNLHVLADTGP
jgi:hypothetical protein